MKLPDQYSYFFVHTKCIWYVDIQPFEYNAYDNFKMSESDHCETVIWCAYIFDNAIHFMNNQYSKSSEILWFLIVGNELIQ